MYEIKGNLWDNKEKWNTVKSDGWDEIEPDELTWTEQAKMTYEI